jgi:lipoprotein-anchoring transpeptidase ErfK/SrfK
LSDEHVVRRRPLVIVAGLACLVLAAGLIWAAGDRIWPDRASALGAVTRTQTPRSTSAHSVATTPATTAPITAPPPVASTTTPAPPQVPVSTVLAAPNGTIHTFSTPGGAQIGTVGLWYGYRLVLPVVAEQPEWLQVRLPQRPNQSTAWVKAADVTLSSTSYRIVVSLSATHLTVYRAGFPILRFPAGIGTTATPTVTGSYFVAVHESHVAAPYGPFVLDTSAHSEAIQSWEGAGDAIIAIHGPITATADARIGTTGTRISNGCIRLHDSDLAQLAVIPVGTPVDIVA